MKQFFKFMFASMLGTFLTLVVLFFILLGIVAGVVSMASKDEVKVSPNSVLVVRLDQPISDRSPKMPFLMAGLDGVMGLNDVTKSLKKAADDENIKGILLDLSDIPAGIATIEEVRDALVAFRESGKFIYAYSNSYTQPAYYLATAADKIFMNPQGNFDFRGVVAQAIFFKGTLDKLNVKVKVVRHGKYKSAIEPFVNDKMSDASREQMTALAQSAWTRMLEAISKSRNIDVAVLNAIADSLKIRSGEDAVKHKFVDQLMYKDELIAFLKDRIGVDKESSIHSVSLENYKHVLRDRKETIDRKNRIAVIYASGTIMNGKSDDGQIGAETFSKAIRKAREDKRVKAVVIRVDSPGGDALASEIIWREVDLTSKVKPVVASFGDVAASGGYYISCAADTILAEAGTITGSIGVFGLVPNFKGFLGDKLGITTDLVKTNKHSDLMNLADEMPAFQEAYLQHEVEQIYQVFIQHVAEGRGIPVSKVDSIGQGRVWSGSDALQIGLIDKIGTLDDAIKIAADMAKIKNYLVVDLPEQRDPIQMLIKGFTDDDIMLKKSLGEYYGYFEYVKSLEKMQGVQARMPFLIEWQ
ncbi:MAG: signal peptide peptidase SppA [Bacteroidetes bacterium]|nr:signal peptide peptidase SppA [Bacteroidota bacterium]